MNPAGPPLQDDATRLQQLRALFVLDTPPEAVFDSIAQMASQACGAPIALLSLIDADRQWFKANVGLPGVGQTPRAVAFCSHAIQGDDLFEVPDATADVRFAGNPLVTGAPDIRFYAGVPLALPEGGRVGTLCVIDREPRRLTAAQADTLRQLARIATQALTLRRDLLQASLQARTAYEQRLADSESLLQRTGRVAGVGGWEMDLASGRVRWTEQTRLIHEVAPDFEPTLDNAISFYAPESQAQITAAVDEGVRTGAPWDLELPFITARGRRLWVRAVGEAEYENGQAVRLIGAFQDITERRALADQLAEREAFLQTLTDSVPVRLAYVDAELRYRFVNQAHCQRFGRPRDQIVGRTRNELLGHASADVDRRIAAVLKGEPQRFEFSETSTDVDGLRAEHAIESRLLPDRDEQGRVRGFFAIGDDITERKAISAQLAEALARSTDLYDNAPSGYYSLDAQGRFLQINQQMLRWLGCRREEALGGLGPRDFFTEAGRNVFRLLFPTFMVDGHFGPQEFELLSRDGSSRWVSVSATALYDAQGGFVSSRSVMHDISEVRAARNELARLNREQLAMLDNDLVGIVKVKGRTAQWNNRAMGRMFGYDLTEMASQPTRLLYADDATHERVGTEAYPLLRQGLHYRTQAQMRRKDGSLMWVDLNGMMLSAEADESLWLFTDITAMKQHQQQVEHIAFHDGLTGLPNRLLLADRIKSALALDNRLGRSLAVCVMDLDGFKAVNDRHGHEAGDRLLRSVADRLSACVRETDTVARLGGDEFVVVLTPLASADEGLAVLQRVIRAIRRPVDLGNGLQAQVSCSIGVALFPQHGHKPAELLRRADEAMYQAKRSGKNQVVACGATEAGP